MPSIPDSGEPPSTAIADALAVEFAALGVLDRYEAVIAVKAATQLDSGLVVGSAFASLSKDLDRRVDALRLKTERPDDPTIAIRQSIEEKQAHLRVVEGDQ